MFRSEVEESSRMYSYTVFQHLCVLSLKDTQRIRVKQ